MRRAWGVFVVRDPLLYGRNYILVRVETAPHVLLRHFRVVHPHYQTSHKSLLYA